MMISSGPLLFKLRRQPFGLSTIRVAQCIQRTHCQPTTSRRPLLHRAFRGACGLSATAVDLAEMSPCSSRDHSYGDGRRPRSYHHALTFYFDLAPQTVFVSEDDCG